MQWPASQSTRPSSSRRSDKSRRRYFITKTERLSVPLHLAHAGENVAGQKGIVSLFDKLKEKMFDKDHLNMFANWLEHPSGPKTATILELEVLAMIQRAISKYNAAYGGITTNMQNFLAGQHTRLN